MWKHRFVGVPCLQAGLRRPFSSSSVARVPLSYTKYPAQKTSSNAPLLICHGLFGSKQNWRSLAKSMSARLSRDVYALDMRNHGESPHAEEHTYKAMADDLFEFIDTHDLQSPILLGHSMGGKVVMAASLQQPSRVKKLVVVDIAPFSMALSNDFACYVKAMREIDAAQLKKQSEADKILQKYESDIGIRQFLLTNLKRDHDGTYRFRIPYNTLGSSLHQIGDFGKDLSTQTYPNPTLFIAGGRSSYSKPFARFPDQVKAMFPQSKVEVVDGAGHWVHAEKPEPFMKLIVDFIGTCD
ncbi:Alpha/Beta hydrolase protein [Dichotomocladium elegans]|nr:Alpha/Beta hydrolase protein [Dichotomocladium elegans]